jgi:hypothetical protein
MPNLEDRGVTGPWDDCLRKLGADGLIPASVEDIINKRILSDRKSCADGSWTAENFNYLPGGKILVANRDHNPLIPNAHEARMAHERQREYSLDKETAEKLVELSEEDREKEPEERRVYRLVKGESYAVTIGGMIDDSLMRFLAKDSVQGYCALLRAQGLRAMRIQVLDTSYRLKQRDPFAKALWFDDLISGLVGNTDLTHYNPGRLYGVPASSSDG